MERDPSTADADNANTIITSTNDDNTTTIINNTNTTTIINNTTTTNVDRVIRLPLLPFSSSSLSSRVVSPKASTIYFPSGVSQLFQERITAYPKQFSNNFDIKFLPSLSACASGLIHRSTFTIPYLFSASPLFPKRSIPTYTTQFYNISSNIEGIRNIGFVWFGGVQVAVEQPQAIELPLPVLPVLPVLPPPPVLHEIKVMIIGARSTGKSSLLGCFQNEREGNLWRINFPIRNGLIRFVCIEILDQDLYINSQTNSFQTDGIILLVDALNASTCKLACDLYHKAFLSIGLDMSKPIVIACNKSETHPKKHVDSRPKIDVGVKIPSYYISAKNNVATRKPFLGIAKAIGLKLGVLAQWDLDSDAG